MLTLKSLVTFAAVAVFSATAAPAPGPSPTPGEGAPGAISIAEASLEARGEVQARDYATVRICKNHYFNDCMNVGINDGQCLGNLSNVWNDVISSYEVVNWGQFYCIFYEHAGCTGAQTDVQSDNTLHDDGGWWADRISSIKCWRRVPNGGGGCGAPFC